MVFGCGGRGEWMGVVGCVYGVWVWGVYGWSSGLITCMNFSLGTICVNNSSVIACINFLTLYNLCR